MWPSKSTFSKPTLKKPWTAVCDRTIVERFKPQRWQRSSQILALGLLSALLTSVPGLAAERITITYWPFGEFYLSVQDLELFAQDGTVTADLAFYARFASPDALKDLQEVLSRKFPLDAVTISQLTYTTMGENLLRQISPAIITADPKASFYYLRSALILAAADPEGLTILNILRQYGASELNFNTQVILQLANVASRLIAETDAIIAMIQQEGMTAAQAESEAGLTVSNLPDISQLGAQRWTKERFEFVRNRDRVPVALYLPQDSAAPAPLIIISPGLASGISTFEYLAQHLASQGFAVAILEFPTSGEGRVSRFLRGFATEFRPLEWVEQPLYISALIDELEQRVQNNPGLASRMDLTKIGLLGQSLGGYTVLATAGGQLEWPTLQRVCGEVQTPGSEYAFNLALILQCPGEDDKDVVPTKPLHDRRVSAVLAINPVTFPAFGDRGLAQLQVPAMIVTSSDDYFAPPVPEQIVPFTQLGSTQKYLVTVKNGTHFSFLGAEGSGTLPIPSEILGPELEVAKGYMRSLSTAFFKVHLAGQEDYASYLSASYAQQISQETLALTVLKNLTSEQLEQARRQVR